MGVSVVKKTLDVLIPHCYIVTLMKLIMITEKKCI